VNFQDIQGMTIKEVDGLRIGSEEIVFHTSCGKKFRMYHESDCCEKVKVVDVSGDKETLVGQMVVLARESSSGDDEESLYYERSERVKQLSNLVPQFYDSNTWTFYTLATIKGWVDIRWLGTSNGYYSESVTFEEIE